MRVVALKSFTVQDVVYGTGDTVDVSSWPDDMLENRVRNGWVTIAHDESPAPVSVSESEEEDNDHLAEDPEE